MNKLLILSIILALSVFSCSKLQKNNVEGSKMSLISELTIKNVIDKLVKKHGKEVEFRVKKGVTQTAAFWNSKDGSEEEFEKFCNEYFVADPIKLAELFETIQRNQEVLIGNFNKMNVSLKFPLHVDDGKELNNLDMIYGGFDPSSQLYDDMFQSKIAFVTTLNFPFYSLKEKLENGENWSRGQWAYARVGDLYNARIPADLMQKFSVISTNADQYIAEYNIMMGYLVDDKGNTYFDKSKKLISHWNLRDELKSQYGQIDGLTKQNMIYEVMKRIITQEIPNDVINDTTYQWNPYTNKVFKNGKTVDIPSEPNTRYQHWLNTFKILKEMDPYSPNYSTFISRKFDQEMEMPQEEVEKLFVDLVSSPTVKKVADLIKNRLGRDLQPYDIWYDGFKARSSMNQDELSDMTRKKYPNPQAFENDIPNMLMQLGFTPEKAKYIADKIAVDPSRGAGHAWGASMKSDKARLRSRIGKDGMDYKGYNIAVHEFGHNVEQTITLYDVDYYMLFGVPNTAFTEAMAFIFQQRDLTLLGKINNDPNAKYLHSLDNFWSCYEIMGVSIMDMRVWKWLYANPNATAEQLKNEVIKVAKDVWNSYYAPVFGQKDQPILAIYSHTITNPLYLSAYPIGHLVEFQVEQFAAGKNLSNVLESILKNGRITPNQWMLESVAAPLSTVPVINATEEALKYVK